VSKNILCTEVSVDGTFDPFIVQVADDHEAVKFCELWEPLADYAWINTVDDPKHLVDMWSKLEKLPRIEMPCMIDHLIYGWFY